MKFTTQAQLVRVTVFLFFTVLGLQVCLLGQGNFGAINGTVYDATGAVVPGASVTVRNLDTGLELKTTTTSVGSYLSPNLPTGQYSVTVTKQGFKTFEQQPVDVSTATTSAVNVTLEVGSSAQTTSVVATAAQLQSTTSDVGTVMGADFFRKIPYDILGMSQQSGVRQPQQFIFFVPGVTGSLFNYRVNGGQAFSETTLIDGHNWQLLNRPGLMNSWPLPFEAIQEFKLQTAQFGAQSAVGTAVTQFTLKAGTDRYHGSISDLARNSALNARGFFTPERVPYNQNEGAITFGGPVVKKKTHFFVTVTRYSLSGPTTVAGSVATVPTPEMKNGDFTAWPRPIFDPATTQPDGSGGFTRQQFSCNGVLNVICPDRIGTVGKNTAALMPDPTLPGVQNNFVIVGAHREHMWQWSAKVDHSWTPNEITRVSIFGQNRVRSTPNGYGGPLDSGTNTIADDRNIFVSHTSVFSGRLVNEARWGLAPWIDPQTNTGLTNVDGTKALGIPNLPSIAGVTPRLSISNLSPTLGNSGSIPFNSTRRNFSFGDTLSWVKGAHQLKFGFSGFFSMDDTLRGLNELGIFTFSNRTTSQPDAPQFGQWGNGFASFLLGDVYSANRLLFNNAIDRERTKNITFFVQDDYKVSNKLTLNLGLNYHIPFVWYDPENRMSKMDPSVPNPGAGGLPGALVFAGSGPGRIGRSTLADTYYKAFAPRFGLAYQINEKTVFRGGVGIYYGYSPGNITLNGDPRDGFTYVQDEVSLDQGITSPFNINDGFPVLNIQLPDLNPALDNGSSTTFVSPHAGRPPFGVSWSAEFQRQLPYRIFLDVGYVANKWTRLPASLENINQLNPSYLSLGSLLNQNIYSAAAVNAGYLPPYAGFQGTVGQSLRPFPQYTSVSNHFQTTGYSNYQSLQVTFQRRFAHGLMLMNNYTFSKLLDTGHTEQGAANPLALNTFDQSQEYSLSSTDQTHTFVSTLSYELPVGVGKRWLNHKGALSQIVGNWTIADSLNYHSGTPLSVTSGQALPLFGGSNRPNLDNSQPIKGYTGSFDPHVDRWLNLNAFPDPAPFTFGNLGRTLPNFRGPGYANEDFTLTKVIIPREGETLDFYVTAYNAFNRTVFGNPNGSTASVNFGKITSQANVPRELEIGARFLF